MDTLLMWILAFGALIGGIDRIAGNRFGLGKRFEEGFALLGPTALSMAGIICLTPLLSKALTFAVVPLCTRIGLDPAMLGGILAIDMGGYQLSVSLSHSAELGRYAGLVVAATFGCTITFTIPVGMGMLEDGDRTWFSRGMLIGLGALPVGLLVGGLFCTLSVTTLLLQSLPFFLLCLLLMAGIQRFPNQTIRCFSAFADLLRILTTIGLIAGAFCYMTGVSLIPGLTPLEDAMTVVSSIGIVLLGSLPTAELLQRILRRPLSWIGDKTGINSASSAGLLIGFVSPVPVLAMLKDMDSKGKVVNAACLVCSTSALAAHMGFTFGVDPDFAAPLLITKLIGGIAGAAAALIFTRNDTAENGIDFRSL
ncbi:MAG: ethanolamine utilization protein EutH [Fusicatenibacter sp.]|nr:ethanolamine utilization protein EutH [Fusicatenibacter sp.]